MQRAETVRNTKEQVKNFYEYETNNLLRRNQGPIYSRNGIT